MKKLMFLIIITILIAVFCFGGCAVPPTIPTPEPMPEELTAHPTPQSEPSLPPIPVDEVSLEEAERIMGTALAPTYLPTGWEFKRGFVFYDELSPPNAYLLFLFSDEDMTGEVETVVDVASLPYKMVLDVRSGREMPPPGSYDVIVEHEGGKVVDINGTEGRLSASGSTVIWYSGGLFFSVYILMPEELPPDEAVRIAQSIK